MADGMPMSSFRACTSISKPAAKLPPAPRPILVVDLQDLSIASSAPNEVTSSFSQWLSERLCKEQELLAGQFKELLAGQLQGHREACMVEFQGQLSSPLSAQPLQVAAGQPPAAVNPARGSSQVSLAAHVSLSEVRHTPPKHLVDPDTTSHLNAPANGHNGTHSPYPSDSNGSLQAGTLAVAQELKKAGSKLRSMPSVDLMQKNKMAQALHCITRQHEFEVDLEMNALVVQAQHMVRDWRFEIASMVVIMMNTCMLGFEIQYHGFDAGYRLKYGDHDRPAVEIWPDALNMFTYCSVVFATFFVAELSLRLLAMRQVALTSAWIWCDLILVPLGMFDVLQKLDLVEGLGFNPTMLRNIRLLRLMRLARTMKGKDAFHSLFLLVKSVKASVTALFWSILILFLIMCSFSMLVNQFFRSYFDDDFKEVSDRRDVFKYFGTFTRTLLTMFEITFGNWVPATRLVMISLGEGWSAVFVVYRCVLCFAILNVIRAVFITETTRVASNDDEVALMVREANAKGLNRKLDTMFQALDHSGDGCIDWEDFEKGMTDPILMSYMNLLDIDCTDLYELFLMLDNGDGQVDCKEFAANVKSLRGSARSLEMITTLATVQRINGNMEILMAKLT